MVTRQHLLSCITLLALVPAVFGQLVTDPSRRGNPAADRSTHLAPAPTIRQVLRKPVSRVHWDETSVKDVFKWFSEQGFENVVPVWRTLRAEEIYPSDPLTLSLVNTTVGRVLSEVLDQLSDEIRWRAIGNVLRISTRSDFGKDLYTKVYRLAEVTLDMPDFYPEQSLFGITDIIEEATYTREERLERIRDIVIRTVAPDSWIDNGGVGSIELVYEYNAMVVRNTPEVHTMIDGDFRLEDAISTPAQRSERAEPQQPPRLK